MKTVAIIQARMGSHRLPGKVMMDIAGRPMLARVYERTAQAERVDQVVVATTDEGIDDPVAELCQDGGWSCFRGSHLDVLDRYYRAAQSAGADVVVRVTADCPLIDPQLIDRVVDGLAHDSVPAVDYASNTLAPRTYPRGLDVEAFTRTALERAWGEATDPSCREHVTPYFYRNPEAFRLLPIRNDRDESAHRWTVDTPEDLSLARAVYEEIGDRVLDWRETLAVVAGRPDLTAINAHIQQKAA